MKNILLSLFIFLMFFPVLANAQNSITVSQLIPVASNIGKFSKRLPANRNRIINRDNLKFEIAADSVNLTDNKKGVAVTIKTIYKEVVFDSIGGKLTGRLNIYGRITSDEQTTDGFFEERLSENVEKDDLVNGHYKEIVLRKIFELPEGNYQIRVIITDITSGMRGVKGVKFRISNSINTRTND